MNSASNAQKQVQVANNRKESSEEVSLSGDECYVFVQ